MLQQVPGYVLHYKIAVAKLDCYMWDVTEKLWKGKHCTVNKLFLVLYIKKTRNTIL